MTSDDALLVRRNDKAGNPGAVCGNHFCICVISGRFHLEPQPSQSRADFFPHEGGVFTDTGGKNQSIQALKGGCQRSDFPQCPVDKKIDGKLGAGRVACQQISHIVTDAGKTQKPRLTVEKRGHLFEAVTGWPQKVQDHARVEIAAARSHRKPVEGGKSHRRGDAVPTAQRAEARTVAQMGGDDAALGH